MDAVASCPLHEGAEPLVLWTLERLRKIREDAAHYLEDARMQLEIAELCHHEAVMAERGLQALAVWIGQAWMPIEARDAA